MLAEEIPQPRAQEALVQIWEIDAEIVLLVPQIYAQVPEAGHQQDLVAMETLAQMQEINVEIVYRIVQVNCCAQVQQLGNHPVQQLEAQREVDVVLHVHHQQYTEKHVLDPEVALLAQTQDQILETVAVVAPQ